MKKILYLLPIILTSCVNFQGTDKSVWSGGMWIIPALLFGSSIFFFYKAFKESMGGTRDYEYIDGKPVLTEDDKHIPIHKTPHFYYSVGTFILGVIFVIITILEA